MANIVASENMVIKVRRKLVFGGDNSGTGSPPPTTGQLWPRAT